MPKIIRGLAQPTLDMRCGTTAGYKAHRKRNEFACSDCKLAINKYQESITNKETRQSYHKKHYAQNKDKRKAQARKYYSENKQKVALMNKRYRAEHQQEHKEHNRRWRQNNRLKARASSLLWARRNPEYRRLSAHRRRAAKKGQPYTEQQVLEHYGTLCHICGTAIDLEAPRQNGKVGWEKGLHLDHVMPIALGGSDEIANVRPAHGLCNIRKGKKAS